MKIFYWLFYWLSSIFPRSNKIWVFGSRYGDQFVDNPKWFFLYCNRMSDNIRFIWITTNNQIIEKLHSQKLTVYHKNSLKGRWYSLRAKVYIFDCHYSRDINFWTSNGSLKVNLWHGIALKKIERDIKILDNERYKFFHIKKNLILRILEKLNPKFSGIDNKYDLMVSTSQVVTKIFSSAFGISKEDIAITGFPRNDLLLDNKYRTEEFIIEHLPEALSIIKEKKRILLYMPTFRESKTSNDLPFDLEKLNELLEKSNAVLLIKLHSEDRRFVNLLGNLSNIISLSNKIDVYPLLSYTYLLITDYSSIYFDYLLLDKPIIFYAYDLETYLTSERGLYFKYESVTPGQKVFNFPELECLLKKYFDNYDVEDSKWKLFRNKITEQFHCYKDFSSCQRVYDVINKHI